MFVFELISFAANFCILAHLVEFVKHFLQVFSNSFVRFVALQAIAVHHTTFLVYHRIFRLSRTFFDLFQTFFCSRRRSCSNSHILAQHIPFVKHFFTKTALIFCALCSPSHMQKAAPRSYLPGGCYTIIYCIP